MEFIRRIEQEISKIENKFREKKARGFRELMMNYLKKVNDMQVNADRMIEKFVSGEASLQDVLVAAQEANISFRMLMEIRNKIIDAYREVIKMRV